MTEDIKSLSEELAKSGLKTVMADLTHLNIETALFLQELNRFDLEAALQIVKLIGERANADGNANADVKDFFSEKIKLLEMLIPMREQMRAYQIFMLENDKVSGRLDKMGLSPVVDLDKLRKSYGMEKSS
jgi:hypothetical protein